LVFTKPLLEQQATEPQTWLVIGGTGMAGYGVLRRLSAQSPPGTTILAITRGGGYSAWLEGTPEGVTVVNADLQDGTGLATALKAHPPVTHIFYSAVVRASFDSSNKWLEKMDITTVRQMQRGIGPCFFRFFARCFHHSMYTAFNNTAGGGDVAENRAVFENVLHSVDASKLRYCCVVTGAKHYGMHLGPDFLPEYAEPFEEDVGPECPGDNFYTALEDSLRKFAKPLPHFSSLVLRPTFIIGPSPRVGSNVMNLSLCLGVYALLCKELKKPLVFLGSPESWLARHNLSHNDRIAALAINGGSALKGSASMALNAADQESFSFEEVWPQLAAWAGVEWKGPQGRHGVSIKKALGDNSRWGKAWSSVADRDGLCERRLDRLFNPVFLEQTMSIAHNCRLSADKASRIGWAVPVKGGGWSTLQLAIKDLHVQGLLPEQPGAGGNAVVVMEYYEVTNKTGLTVRRGPDAESDKVVIYPMGTTFKVLGRVNRRGWIRLRTPDGWVSESSFKHGRRLIEPISEDDAMSTE
jgi:nucleoside-diphosphate-sugar epimerase